MNDEREMEYWIWDSRVVRFKGFKNKEEAWVNDK